MSHYNGSDDEVQTDSSCQFLGVGELLPTIDPGWQCEIRPFPCSLWFKAWKDGEDLIPHQQCQEGLELTYRAADSPVILPYWSGLGRSLSDVEGFSPPEWDVFTSGALLIHRNLNVLLSASEPPAWRCNMAVSLKADLTSMSGIPVFIWSSVSSLQKALLGRSEGNKKCLDANQDFYKMSCVLWLFFLSNFSLPRLRFSDL